MKKYTILFALAFIVFSINPASANEALPTIEQYETAMKEIVDHKAEQEGWYKKRFPEAKPGTIVIEWHKVEGKLVQKVRQVPDETKN